MPVSREEAEFLLNKHNPHLVICPRPDRNNPELARPYEAAHGRPRGDYHPHKVELFLKYLERYDAVRPFRVTNVLYPQTWPWPRLRKWPLLPWNWVGKPLPEPAFPGDPPGFEKVRELVATLPIGASAPWEVDFGPITSQDPDQAWQVYRGLLQTLPEEETEAVVYGRCAETASGTVLQYWYFYLYNDSGNKHEGDWEMVSIVLDSERRPQRVGFAGHTGGARRAWKGLRDPHGNEIKDRPYVYVARGSHAAYLDYMPRGHKSVSVEYRKNLTGLGPLLNLVARSLSRFVFFMGVRDFTPGHPEGRGAVEKGIELNPRVIVLPERGDLLDREGCELAGATGEDFRGNGEWWWMHLDCRWGSSHSRFFSSIGPEPPWMKPRWRAPLAWVDALNER